ncbi:MAG: hypothetical protein KDA54_10455 [Phycisphaerales bacterium]|nr:hypothetical protein [Phycisphaerales bacterium]
MSNQNLHLVLSAIFAAIGPYQIARADNADPGSAERYSPVRKQVSINDRWHVTVQPMRLPRSPYVRASSTSIVNLPHTWNALDGQDGGANYLRTTGIYVRRISIPQRREGERVFLRVGAANIVATVLVNGQFIGEHRGGYSAFVLELTDVVDWGQDNDLMIVVDNAIHEDVPPYGADFTFFGGIYRDVSLLFTDSLCISPLDHASSGVYLRTNGISAESARVTAFIKLSNRDSIKSGVRAQLNIIDHDGDIVATKDATVANVPIGESATSISIDVVNPHLWQGVDDPYLYTARLTLDAGDRSIDCVEESFGIRTFDVDPDHGFTLNGKSYALRGVNRHQDRPDVGWAISRKHHDEDFAMIREMGCTAVRLAHYQQDPYAYSLCDQLGLVVWAEIPLINRVFHTDSFRSNCRQQLIELIRQNYNHPSICFWGVHNEITAPWEPGPDPIPLVTELAQLTRTEDPTRKSVCAATTPDENLANWQTQLVAFNRYFGWYHDSADDFGPWVDEMHKKHPAVPIGISEYGAGANVEHHELPPRKSQHNSQWHPEEYQAVFHESHWRQISARPFIWGSFVWNMFDFACDQRNEGGAPGRNDKGLVTYDRLIKKDAFYWYKANWSDEPFVHITSRRMKQRNTQFVSVKVYSNCDQVSISVGDRTYPAQQSSNHLFEWPQVSLSAGSNTIRAVGTTNGETVTDECEWDYAAQE